MARSTSAPVQPGSAGRTAGSSCRPVAITGKLGRFRGESRFTTWAYKFVIFEVPAKIGRHFWQNPGVRLDAEDWDKLPDRFGFEPAREAEWRVRELCSFSKQISNTTPQRSACLDPPVALFVSAASISVSSYCWTW